jgi:hypothetical protein
MEQAINYSKAIFKGDPDRGQMIVELIKQKVAEFFPA